MILPQKLIILILFGKNQLENDILDFVNKMNKKLPKLVTNNFQYLFRCNISVFNHCGPFLTKNYHTSSIKHYYIKKKKLFGKNQLKNEKLKNVCIFVKKSPKMVGQVTKTLQKT